MAAEKKSTESSSTTRSSAKKSTSKSPTGDGSPAKKASGRSRSAQAPRTEARRRMTGARVAEAAARQLRELSSKEVEGVTALHRTDDGWEVELEVLELRRIPATTDVLATYVVTIDTSGELEEYRRAHRYVRGQAEGST